MASPQVDRHAKIESIFLQAVVLPEQDRNEYLALTCEGDPDLRSEVEHLLMNDPGEETAKLRHPHRIGRFDIHRVLGEGGMGTVYLAEQSNPTRTVALKVIRRGFDSAKEVLRRFEVERQALALLNHPNIAHFYEAGTTEDGQPYFALELVEGDPITDYCDASRLTVKERLRLFIEVCNGVQHAHQKGIIHRDLKPSNVLVSIHNEVPVPKLIDFGVAKALDWNAPEHASLTQLGHLIGTPAYMSPEQAAGNSIDVDTRADIYSLGVVLFELLVGTPPFDSEALQGHGVAETQRVLHHVEPLNPSAKFLRICNGPRIAAQRGTDSRMLSRQLSGDIDWIVMKCLEKERSRRYPTVNAVAQDIQRFLSDEPVIAGPPSALYRIKKLVRRNKLKVASATLIMVALTIGLVVSDLQRRRALRAERLAAQRSLAADEARNEAETVTQFLLEMIISVSPEEKGKDITVLEALDAAAGTIAKRFSDQPLLQARIQHVVGLAYRRLGRYIDAESCLSVAAQVYASLKGDAFPRTLQTAADHAAVIGLMGDYSRAEVVQRRIVEAQRNILGAESPDSLQTTLDLAATLSDQGREFEAEVLIRKVCDIRRRFLGDEHPETLSSLVNLSACLFAQGRYAEVEALCIPQVETSVLGEFHPTTIRFMGNLALSFSEQGCLIEAESLYRRILANQVQVLGDSHPELLNTKINYAITLSELGRYAEAAELELQALQTRRRVLGDEHADTLVAMNNLAVTYKALGRNEESEALDRQTLEVRRRVLGEEHPHTLSSMNNVAESLVEEGRFAEAEPLVSSVLLGAKKFFPPNHPLVGVYRKNYGVVLKGLDRLEEAESLLLESFSILSASGWHEETRKTAQALLELYEVRCSSKAGSDYHRNVAEWRAKLEELEGEME